MPGLSIISTRGPLGVVTLLVLTIDQTLIPLISTLYLVLMVIFVHDAHLSYVMRVVRCLVTRTLSLILLNYILSATFFPIFLLILLMEEEILLILQGYETILIVHICKIETSS